MLVKKLAKENRYSNGRLIVWLDAQDREYLEESLKRLAVYKLEMVLEKYENSFLALEARAIELERKRLPMNRLKSDEQIREYLLENGQLDTKDKLIARSIYKEIGKQIAGRKILFIYDNADRYDQIEDMIVEREQVSNFDILITTRNSDLEDGICQNKLILDLFNKEEVSEYFRIREIQVSDEELHEFMFIMSGDTQKILPLILAQVASYLKQKEVSLRDYIADYKKNLATRQAILVQIEMGEYQKSLETILAMSLDSLSTFCKKDNAALDIEELLEKMSLFNVGEIPLTITNSAGEFIGNMQYYMPNISVMELQKAERLLISYSIIEDNGQGYATMHRNIRELVIFNMIEKNRLWDRVFDLVSCGFYDVECKEGDLPQEYGDFLEIMAKKLSYVKGSDYDSREVKKRDDYISLSFLGTDKEEFFSNNEIEKYVIWRRENVMNFFSGHNLVSKRGELDILCLYHNGWAKKFRGFLFNKTEENIDDKIERLEKFAEAWAIEDKNNRILIYKYRLAICKIAEGREKDAVEDLESLPDSLVDKHPLRFLIYMFLGSLYRKSGEYMEATERLSLGVAVDSELRGDNNLLDYGHFQDIAWLYEQWGRLDDFILLLEEKLAKEDSNSQEKLNLKYKGEILNYLCQLNSYHGSYEKKDLYERNLNNAFEIYHLGDTELSALMLEIRNKYGIAEFAKMILRDKNLARRKLVIETERVLELLQEELGKEELVVFDDRVDIIRLCIKVAGAAYKGEMIPALYGGIVSEYIRSEIDQQLCLDLFNEVEKKCGVLELVRIISMQVKGDMEYTLYEQLDLGAKISAALEGKQYNLAEQKEIENYKKGKEGESQENDVLREQLVTITEDRGSSNGSMVDEVADKYKNDQSLRGHF